MSKSSSRNFDVLEAILRKIRRGRSFLVTTHENPDGDTLGSALALAQGLRQLKKRVKVYNQGSIPSSLRFLPGSSRVTSRLDSKEKFDVSFLVDCADFMRVGEEFSRHRGLGCKIVLDHHVQSGCEGDLNLVEVAAASSGMVVYQVLKKAGIRIDRAIATNIYCTLVADTGNFRYVNTTASVLELAGEMVRQGVRPSEVSRNLNESYPKARLELLRQVLGTLELKARGRIGSVVMTLGMLRKSGATVDLAGDFVEFPRSLSSVEVAVLIREMGPGRYKVSLRSKGRLDVGGVAALFGGGGHVRAAGCSVGGNLAAVKKQIYGILEKRMQGRTGK